MSTWSHNRQASFRYELKERLEAGLELRGFEVKAVKQGKMSLAGAYVSLRGGEAYLLGATVAPYQLANIPADYDPSRPIRLLLQKKELAQLLETENQRGLTIIPLSVYSNGRRLKLGVAIARGKKSYDKRQAIKKRESQREIARTLKEE